MFVTFHKNPLSAVYFLLLFLFLVRVSVLLAQGSSDVLVRLPRILFDPRLMSPRIPDIHLQYPQSRSESISFYRLRRRNHCEDDHIPLLRFCAQP
jgi:hypothetical protein